MAEPHNITVSGSTQKMKAIPSATPMYIQAYMQIDRSIKQASERASERASEVAGLKQANRLVPVSEGAN